MSLIYTLFICLVALLANHLAPYSYKDPIGDPNLFSTLFPSLKFPFGTDQLSRDLFSRCIYGAQMSMSVGIVTAVSSLVLGLIYGGISGYVGGRLDGVLMRIVDVLFSFPSLLLIILIQSMIGRGLLGIYLALTIVGWVSTARLVRGQVLQVKEMVYVEAARSIGSRGTMIVFRHIFPNILGPLIVTLTFNIPNNILAESFLSFLGLGVPPPYASWGSLARDGYQALQTYPHLIFFPSILIFLVVLAFNLLGDGLRDALDPKMKR
ncbi:MAG: peptide ABC transporter permease [Deltaproteobacteria bacterium RIFCSPHIGHO2_12_FULL_43_9]|nr:MAG: peptide ABC transporter permease [Deltaproteobacteria bacterium RIFCSPHIGHO2_12_FULL_43_9]